MTPKLAEYHELFGADHPNTVEARIHLAIALVALGETREARDLLVAAADFVRSKAGEAHSLYRLAREHLARLPPL